jgi:hypothetical protein
MAVSRTRYTLKPLIERWLRKTGKSRQDLAEHLGLRVEDLDRLMNAEIAPNIWSYGNSRSPAPHGWLPQVLKLHAERFGATHSERLDDVVNLRVEFNIGDLVRGTGTNYCGRINKIKGDGPARQYWIDCGPTGRSGPPIIFQREDEDGAFDANGPYTADELEAWY